MGDQENGRGECFRKLTPRENTNVAQSVLVPDQVRRLALGDAVDLALRREAVVQHLVQALGLGLVAVDGVGDLLGGVCGKEKEKKSTGMSPNRVVENPWMDGWMRLDRYTHNARNGCAGGRWKNVSFGNVPQNRESGENSLGLPLHWSDAALLCF
jgi:hypothetical protein